MINPAAIFVTLLCLAAGACTRNDSMVATADYQARHPIELREDTIRLDVFAARGLDARARAQVAEFAAAYNRNGTGPVVIMVPVGTTHDKDYRRQFDGVRHVLVASGLRGNVKLGAYAVSDPRLVAPVQLSFTGVKGRVPGPCGQWPEDLASGSSSDGWGNEQYHNFGCAYQSMIAAQAADPRDLVGKQAASTNDADQSVRAIVNTRRAVDPAANGRTR
jgi:pilus assembly protein CpaD